MSAFLLSQPKVPDTNYSVDSTKLSVLQGWDFRCNALLFFKKCRVLDSPRLLQTSYLGCSVFSFFEQCRRSCMSDTASRPHRKMEMQCAQITRLALPF